MEYWNARANYTEMQQQLGIGELVMFALRKKHGYFTMPSCADIPIGRRSVPTVLNLELDPK